MCERRFNAQVGSGFLRVKSGMTVIVTDMDGAWRMADVSRVDGGSRNSRIPTMFHVAVADRRHQMG